MLAGTSCHFVPRSITFTRLELVLWLAALVRTWTYRRAHVAGPDELLTMVYKGDVTQMNWVPGNDQSMGYFMLPVSTARQSVKVL